MNLSEPIKVCLEHKGDEFTPDEPWAAHPSAADWYGAACNFACDSLGSPKLKPVDSSTSTLLVETMGKCLVIGSPMFEARALKELGWHVLYLDVREPPVLWADGYVQGDVCEIPFKDDTFDALSSTCVLCHAGLGRYGDPIRPDADRMALAEMKRVLCPGGRAAVMFGPSVPALTTTVTMGNVHRLYNPEAAVRLAQSVGFHVLEFRLWYRDRWLDESGLREYVREATRKITTYTKQLVGHCYISMLMEA